MKHDKQILDLLIERNIIPSSGTFEVTQSIIDAFYEVYREIYVPKTSKTNKKSNITYAKKLAGLSLLKLNLERIENKSIKKRVSNPKCGIVYLISNPSFVDYYKIGMTKDLDKRLAQYQTGDPHRAYKVEHYRFVEDARLEEANYLKKMHTDLAKGEWVKSKRAKELFLAG